MVLRRDAGELDAWAHAEERQRLEEAGDVEVAAAHDREVAGRGRREVRRVGVGDDLGPEGAHSLEVVGEGQRGRLTDDEAQAGGEVTLHRRAARAAAHQRPV